MLNWFCGPQNSYILNIVTDVNFLVYAVIIHHSTVSETVTLWFADYLHVCY